MQVWCISWSVWPHCAGNFDTIVSVY